MKVRIPASFATAAMIVVVMSVAVACGGSKKDPRRFEGSAAQAVAQYWQQEASGGRLPEGVSVDGLGTQGIATLEVSKDHKDEGVKARVCVEFKYTRLVTPFDSPVRVYVATLLKSDQWSVEAVNPNGTCQEVA